MAEKDYLREALTNFTQEAASGGAIRHLADLGYTVKQIQERLDFPTSCERVQRVVWERLLETGVILREEPGKPEVKETVSFVREYDRFGKASFRRVVQRTADTAGKVKNEGQAKATDMGGGSPAGQVKNEGQAETADAGQGSPAGKAKSAGQAGGIAWRERRVEAAGSGKAAALLRERMPMEDGLEESGRMAYLSCDFGVTAYRKPQLFAAQMECLDPGQREYVEGLPWEKRIVYHRLDRRMWGILIRLCEGQLYCGACYFMDSGEKLLIGQAGICAEASQV